MKTETSRSLDYLTKVPHKNWKEPIFEGYNLFQQELICICDMIKRNESDVGNTDFELQAKTGDKCLWFILFLITNDWSYLNNQMSD